MTAPQRKFIHDLEAVSAALAVWAQARFSDGWSIDDVLIQLRAAAKVARRG